jgi:hypothetical protein
MIALVQSTLPDPTHQDKATVVTATMVGALQLARTLDGKEGRAILAQTRRSLIERHGQC